MAKYKIVKGQRPGFVRIKGDNGTVSDDLDMDDLMDDSTLDDFDDWAAERVKKFDDAQFDAYLAKIGRKVNRIPMESRQRAGGSEFLSSAARKAADTEARIERGVQRIMAEEQLNYPNALAKLLMSDRELEFEFRQLALHRARFIPPM